MGGVYIEFKVGRAGGGGGNASYITRGSATGRDERAIGTYNYPDYVTDASDYKELRDRIIEYNRQQEQDEMDRPQKGRGEARTHYRAIASFEGKVESEYARTLGSEWVERNFPKSRAVIAVHQDTEHTHCHINIQARGTDGKKLNIAPKQYRNLDQDWARIYGREFGLDKYHEHVAKKKETREFKRAIVQGEKKPKPERADRQLIREDFKSREQRNHGTHQSRVRRDQRRSTDGDPATQGGKSELEGIARTSQRAAGEANRAVQAARESLRAVEAIRDRANELEKGGRSR